MSRRDKIIFLATSQNQNQKPHVSEPFEPINHQLIPNPSIIKPIAEKSFSSTFTRHSLTCYETLPSSDEEYECINRAVNYFEDSDDSVLDKDYCPEFILSDSDSNSPIRIKRNLLVHKETRRKKTEREEAERDEKTERVEIDCEETEREELGYKESEREEIDHEETEREDIDGKETELGEFDREETACENSEVIPENEKETRRGFWLNLPETSQVSNLD